MLRPVVHNQPSIRRMPVYLRVLRQEKSIKHRYVSSARLARMLGVESIVVRKDFALVGMTGVTGVGYEVEIAISKIEDYLGWSMKHRVCMIGLGTVGAAVLEVICTKFASMEVAYVFDSDPRNVGTYINGFQVYNIDYLPQVLKDDPVEIAVMCITDSQAQTVINKLSEVGVSAVWNFSDAKFKIPDNMIVQNELFSCGYAVLCRRLIEKRQ